MTDIRIVPCARRDCLGEGPLWEAAGNALYWVDISGKRLNRLSLADDRIDSWPVPEMVGWLVARRDAPGFLAGAVSGVKAVTFDPFSFSCFTELPGHPEGNRLNDAKADSAGNIWAGSMPFGGDRPDGSLYRIDPQGDVIVVDRGYYVANGPAISVDGAWLFHTDTRLGHVYRFALEHGRLGARELWLKFRPEWGSPDGMTFDAEGGLWIAHWGGARVTRFDPDGLAERTIALPAARITSMAFAGAGLDRMFVTSAQPDAGGADELDQGGALFEVDPGVRGLPPHRFGRG